VLHKALTALDAVRPFGVASAHCDIPCKIYDPMPAQIAALTVIRMIDLIEEVKDAEKAIGWHNRIARLVAEKEKQGFLVKEEIRIIWGDFFKAPQFEKHPELHELTHGIMMLASMSKQEVDREAATQLLDRVNRFAEIFWEIKGVETYRATCPYPPSLEVVYPRLG
jgi:nickel superoxide dismutase